LKHEKIILNDDDNTVFNDDCAMFANVPHGPNPRVFYAGILHRPSSWSFVIRAIVSTPYPHGIRTIRIRYYD